MYNVHSIFKDEHDCDTDSYSKNQSCKEDEFQCNDTECIEKSLVCNSRRDCIDGSDELETMCTNFTYDAARCSENPMKFQCHSGACIDLNLTCNSLNDCGGF